MEDMSDVVIDSYEFVVDERVRNFDTEAEFDEDGDTFTLAMPSLFSASVSSASLHACPQQQHHTKQTRRISPMKKPKPAARPMITSSLSLLALFNIIPIAS